MFQAPNDKLCRAEFTCDAPEADAVFLVGVFDGHEPLSMPMARDEGQWTAVLQLPPGNYDYRFVVVYRGRLNVRDADAPGAMMHVTAPSPLVTATGV